MTIAFDATTEATAGTSDPMEWTHTPSGTPRGVFVGIVRNTGSGQDEVSGVTYGGVSMTRVPNSTADDKADDSAGETGSSYMYFLGSSIPTGDQTVSINYTNATSTRWAACVTVTAGGDTQLAGDEYTPIEADTANPSITVTGISGASYAAAVLFSGQNAPGSVTAGTGFTKRQDHDFGNQTAHMESSTSEQASGDQVIAFTAASDDAAMCVAVIEEVSGTQGLTGTLFSKTPTFPQGAIAPGAVGLAGTVFTRTPTFPQGAVTSSYPLTGNVFSKTPTFPQGAITTTYPLTGNVFTKAGTFPTGAITGDGNQQDLTGTLFTKAPTFPQGVVTPGAVGLTGTLFTKAPIFPQGAISATYPLVGTIFTKAPTFPQGTVQAVYVVSGSTFTKAPTFPQGAVTPGTVNLAGVLFTKAPMFPTGTISLEGEEPPATGTIVRMGRHGRKRRQIQE